MNDGQVVEAMAQGMCKRIFASEWGRFAGWYQREKIARWSRDAEAALASLRAAGFDVYRVEDRQGWKFCPVCGRHNRPEDGGISGVAYCSPTNCSAWKIRATFDHETREWVPVGGDS